jgi:MarR family transcriptional regulator, organic hydroperoxide resistance regulator
MKCSDSKYSKCLYFTSNALARKMEKMAVESWKPVDLSPSHAYLLMMVLEEPGLQPGSIAGHLQLTPSTVTRLLDKLEEKKLVVRTTEGKQTNVYPTPKAKALVPELKKCVEHFYKSSTEIFGKDEYNQLISSIHSIADKIET